MRLVDADALIDCIKAAPAAMQWKDAEKELPSHCGDVLLFDARRFFNAHRCAHLVGWFAEQPKKWCIYGEYWNRRYPLERFTHWMPLPAPPEKEGSECS